MISTQDKVLIPAIYKILISQFYGAKFRKKVWTSNYKSYVITKYRLKTCDINGKY